MHGVIADEHSNLGLKISHRLPETDTVPVTRTDAPQSQARGEIDGLTRSFSRCSAKELPRSQNRESTGKGLGASHARSAPPVNFPAFARDPKHSAATGRPSVISTVLAPTEEPLPTGSEGGIASVASEIPHGDELASGPPTKTGHTTGTDSGRTSATCAVLAPTEKPLLTGSKGGVSAVASGIRHENEKTGSTAGTESVSAAKLLTGRFGKHMTVNI